MHVRTGTVLVAIVVDIANETKAAAHNNATDGREVQFGSAAAVIFICLMDWNETEAETSHFC